MPKKTKAAAKTPVASTFTRRKIAFYLDSISTELLSGGGLVLLPAVLSPISAKSVNAEAAVGNPAAFGHEWLVEPLKAAEADGRVLMGWSRWRAKPNPLSWDKWDAFVLKWCGTDQHRSTERGEIIDPDVLTEEAVKLKDLGLLTLVGALPGGFNPKKKKEPAAQKPRRGRHAVGDDDEEEDSAPDDDLDGDMDD